MTSKFGALVATLVAAGLLSMQPLTAEAQTSTAPSTAPQQSTAPTNISEDKLDAAAAAVKKVAALSDKYEQQLAQAPDEQKDGVVREANDALTKAVTEQGLSVEEFSTIMEVAKNDPVVREKIVQRIK
jgi:hypothetical protein